MFPRHPSRLGRKNPPHSLLLSSLWASRPRTPCPIPTFALSETCLLDPPRQERTSQQNKKQIKNKNQNINYPQNWNISVQVAIRHRQVRVDQYSQLQCKRVFSHALVIWKRHAQLRTVPGSQPIIHCIPPHPSSPPYLLHTTPWKVAGPHLWPATVKNSCISSITGGR